MLVTEGTSNAVRVEVAPRLEVHQADDLTAFDGRAGLAELFVVTLP